MVLTHSIAKDGTHIFHNKLANNFLLIGDNGNSIETTKEYPTTLTNTNTSIISCIIGVIKLKVNSYVIIANKHLVTGSILNKEIALIKKYKILSLSGAKPTSEEKIYLDLLDEQLRSGTLYYSVDNQYDITNSLQKQYTTDHPKIDERFWWNKFISTPLLEADSRFEFTTPIIYGYFKSHATIFNGRALQFALLTRRSTERAGTRYFRRGIDAQGNVANFNETEQFVTTDDNHIYSVLQTRGSVPVYWAEVNNLRYKPNLEISTQPSGDATAAHFTQQVEFYGDNFLVNLVNQLGYEQPVKQAYEAAVENLPEKLKAHVHYIYFDFHHECKGMRYDRINLLLDHLINLGYTSDNYFEIDLNARQIVHLQKSVVRTNCMDCLDRTNVVQGAIGRWVLQNTLVKSGYLKSIETPFAKVDPLFNLFFQNFWADNADAVSCAYSGTGALKTDYTRTGKRSYRGALQDLRNSLTRYYKNNYSDGSRQDSYDLFLGKYKPYQDAVQSPFIDVRPAYVQLLPYLMGTSFLIMLAVLYYPRGSLLDLKNLAIIALCLIFNVRSLSWILANGYQYVDWPRLVPLDYLRKQSTYDADGKVTGTKFEKTDYFKGISKKKN